MFDRLLKFSFCGVAFLILPSIYSNKLVANELIDSSTFTDTQSNASLDSLSFLQDRISAQFITRYLQDSNIFLRQNNAEVNVINESVLLGLKGGGLPADPGISYQALYGGNYFYSLSDEFEYDSPADHNFLSGIELRGAFTKLRLNANLEEQGGYARSETFSDTISSAIGESRNVGYKKKRLDFGISREISTSILELGLSIDKYDYNFIKKNFRYVFDTKGVLLKNIILTYMHKLPYVTIIIPYKNNLDYLFSALKSVFKQSYKNFKIMIIYDDEDKSDLFKIKNFFKNIIIKKKIPFEIIVNKNSLGAGHARNVGLKKSKTKYVAFLDSDDVWAKNKLKIQINFMEKNNILISHSSYNIICDNKIIGHRIAKKLNFKKILTSCDIGLSTVIIKKKFTLKI